ncbi:NAD(FAD)-dependent dehydrogenase [Sphaerochaeta pleomorpha str. Grapes]|uniref:NAD(FAD)-dependent dehydrogenase n=1 Tax=Sphaerochaeta pleomorpha (strain ATCC BAA-1885 / DSM 22778 / Grapes) TaxID=158190 RepID=G8QWZ9_SPHPG|nr:FAD-dependent oxidoreductase [Sphaerochaeta pleomorpha]AEV29503.1 NAD(FAD)-dependent dehydrogenase [Sphaerochaeta pleomorpha str. Grapes]
MAKPRRMVVIGGTAAGLSAASKAKRLDQDLQITVFEKSGYISYGACGLPYFVGGLIEKPEQLVSFSVEEMQDKRGISVHIHHEVLSIDRENKQVTVQNMKTGAMLVAPYEILVIATGAVPVRPAIEGIDIPRVVFLRTVEDGILLKGYVHDTQRAVLVGGGFIGLELAEELTQAGVHVTLFEAMDRLLPFLPQSFSRKVQETLDAHGVTVHLNAKIARILSSNGVAGAVESVDGTQVKADLVVLSVGVHPATALARAAGLELGIKDSIVVDDHMQTSDSAIWACGDCAQMRHIITGKPVHIPLGTTANKMGKVAGSVIGGEKDSFAGVLGSMVTKVFDLYIAATGLSLNEAKTAGYDAMESVITKNDKASYYPGGEPNTLNIVFDGTSGRLLGAQGYGSESIAGRINVLVACITAGMTVSQVNDLDLVYAPPVAPVYDPILIAASQALKHVGRS